VSPAVFSLLSRAFLEFPTSSASVSFVVGARRAAVPGSALFPPFFPLSSPYSLPEWLRLAVSFQVVTCICPEASFRMSVKIGRRRALPLPLPYIFLSLIHCGNASPIFPHRGRDLSGRGFFFAYSPPSSSSERERTASLRSSGCIVRAGFSCLNRSFFRVAKGRGPSFRGIPTPLRFCFYRHGVFNINCGRSRSPRAWRPTGSSRCTS